MRQVKPNVGHSEGAAGLTSLIKCVLALERRLVPPNINFQTPNPKSEFALHDNAPEVEARSSSQSERQETDDKKDVVYVATEKSPA